MRRSTAMNLVFTENGAVFEDGSPRSEDVYAEESARKTTRSASWTVYQSTTAPVSLPRPDQRGEGGDVDESAAPVWTENGVTF